MIIDKKIITVDTLEKHTDNVLNEVKGYVDRKSDKVKKTYDAQLSVLSQNLTDETSNRSQRDEQLNTFITNEINRASKAEAELLTAITKEASDRSDADLREVENRNLAIENAKLILRTEMNLAHTNIESTITTKDAQVTSAFQIADANLKDKLDAEVTDRKQAINDLSSALQSEVARREVGDKLVEDRLVQHLASYESIGAQITSHLTTSNPHQITPAMIGAADLASQIELDAKVAVLENTLQNYTKLQDTVEFVLTDKLSTEGNGQSLTGDLSIIKSDTASGNLVVEGNLVVKGTTKTVNQETLDVADNLIVINSDGTSLVNSNSGLAIKTNSSEAYGIVYNPQTKSVNLGSGVISVDGDFVFTNSANNAILTRDDDSKLADGHLLIWDDVNKKAIDGGPVPNGGNGSNIDSTVLNEISTQVQSNTAKITNIQTDVTNITSKLDTKLNTQPINSDGTSQLNTVSNTVVGAINENKNTIDGHIARTDNPHSVTLEQIGAEKAFNKNSAFNRNFADTAPLMNATASAGSSIQVSRSDHVHPTDTSRAPVLHTDALGTYGVASVSEYGHVKVDDSISSTSINPIQNKVIKQYIDTELDTKLNKISLPELDAGATRGFVYFVDRDDNILLKQVQVQSNQDTIPLRDSTGNFYVSNPTLDYHCVNKSFMNAAIADAGNTLEAVINREVGLLNTAITTQETNFNKEIERVEALNTTATNLITEETTKRKDADTALATQLSAQITNGYNSLKASYDPIRDFIVQLLQLDNSKRYVASWKVVDDVATPYWTELDEGELN